MTDKFTLAWDDFKKVLENHEHDMLRAEYNAYVARCNDMAATMGRYLTFPMSFDDWWRHTADEAKDRAKYQD